MNKDNDDLTSYQKIELCKKFARHAKTPNFYFGTYWINSENGFQNIDPYRNKALEFSMTAENFQYILIQILKCRRLKSNGQIKGSFCPLELLHAQLRIILYY